jgi:cell wall-associated NlpC family hydrolase
MTFTGAGSVALAEKDTTLVGLEAAAEDAVNEDTPEVSDTADEETTEAAETEAAEETDATLDTSMSGELAFAQCEEYINVRSDASADSEVVGKVYNNGSVTILGQTGDWYQVQSGNATGYVKAEYFATGEAAEAIAEEVAYNVATVYPEALTVRSEASEDSESIGTVYATDELEVVAYDGDWMKVALGDDVYGYVSAYYVGYDTYYATAETLEEEQARLDQQWLDYLAEQEAEEAAAEQAYQDSLAAEEAAAQQAAWDAEYQAQLAADTQAAEEAQQAAWDAQYQAQLEAEAAQQAAWDAAAQQEDAQAAAEESYQSYLEAQQAADEATQQADEQAALDAAAAAQAEYEAYLAAQAEADRQAQAEADAALLAQQQAEQAALAEQEAAQAQETLNAAQEAENTYTEESYTDTTYTDTTYTEDTYTEDSYTEETYTEDTSSSSSSTGASIVSFATQFVGNPYVWGGTSLTNGADCSGFTQSVFANFGISIPRTAAAQACSGTAVDLSEIQAGDLLFYDNGGSIGHVSIYMGNGQVVHASSSSTGIIISDYGYRTPVSARRYW